MDRAAVFVDAGYLFGAGSLLIANEKLSRGELHLDYDVVLELFRSLVGELTGLPLLRIYWYDGTATGPTAQQLALAYRPSVKLRLGFVNQQGQQKGVDSLVVTDLINLARNRAMADALLLTGDGDMRVGVQQAQEFGVRVHLIGIAPVRDNQAGLLVQEVDSVRELNLAEVQSFLKRAPSKIESAATPWSPTVLAPAAASSTAVPVTLEGVAQRIAGELNPEEMDAVLKESAGGSIPALIDRRLLLAGTQATGGAQLTPQQKRRVRAAFLDTCRKSST
ncbi:MAG TPA: NYN domain-containing protein [Haliangium sp.]|nr:NYN domain-containing protein [Haliangium sp.]